MSCDREDRQKYRSQEYWETRFQEESVNEDAGQHEWFSSYETFRHLILPICKPEETHSILGGFHIVHVRFLN